MRKFVFLVFFTAYGVLLFNSISFAYGEDVLSQTGQYNFFIKPKPKKHVTYYQKMVPCVARKTIAEPREVIRSFPVPAPAIRSRPVLIMETPVGIADGEGPCVTCKGKVSWSREHRDMVAPEFTTVHVPGTVSIPKCVTFKTMRPQWFKVEEMNGPPGFVPPEAPKRVIPKKMFKTIHGKSKGKG